MILVRAVGMSGYVPLECVVGLSHALLCYRSDKCEYSYKYGFEYLGVREIDRTHDLDVLSSVISVATARRLDGRVCSTIIHDVGLSLGYYCAGVVFPNKLRRVFRDIMGLGEYHILARPSHHPHYSSLEFVYTSAWYEYIWFQWAPTLGGECYHETFGFRATAADGFQWAPTLGGECYRFDIAFRYDGTVEVSMGTHPWG